jgi:hypothetical protein
MMVVGTLREEMLAFANTSSYQHVKNHVAARDPAGASLLNIGIEIFIDMLRFIPANQSYMGDYDFTQQKFSETKLPAQEGSFSRWNTYLCQETTTLPLVESFQPQHLGFAADDCESSSMLILLLFTQYMTWFTEYTKTKAGVVLLKKTNPLLWLVSLYIKENYDLIWMNVMIQNKEYATSSKSPPTLPKGPEEWATAKPERASEYVPNNKEIRENISHIALGLVAKKRNLPFYMLDGTAHFFGRCFIRPEERPHLRWFYQYRTATGCIDPETNTALCTNLRFLTSREPFYWTSQMYRYVVSTLYLPYTNGGFSDDFTGTRYELLCYANKQKELVRSSVAFQDFVSYAEGGLFATCVSSVPLTNYKAQEPKFRKQLDILCKKAPPFDFLRPLPATELRLLEEKIHQIKQHQYSCNSLFFCVFL